jgi:hypothetical protein
MAQAVSPSFPEAIPSGFCSQLVTRTVPQTVLMAREMGEQVFEKARTRALYGHEPQSALSAIDDLQRQSFVLSKVGQQLGDPGGSRTPTPGLLFGG